MKTYTRDEIKRIMIDRPGVEFGVDVLGSERFKYDDHGRLLFAGHRSSDFQLAPAGLQSHGSFTIPADNEKPAELPESVKTTFKQQGWGPGAFLIFTALWAETVKLVEASKK